MVLALNSAFFSFLLRFACLLVLPQTEPHSIESCVYSLPSRKQKADREYHLPLRLRSSSASGSLCT